MTSVNKEGQLVATEFVMETFPSDDALERRVLKYVELWNAFPSPTVIVGWEYGFINNDFINNYMTFKFYLI